MSVTVTYTGKGAVDDKHEIFVFLFDHPTPTADSEPIASQTTTKSGGTVAFKGVTQDPVYVVFVYDEAANYDGQSGPPPAGAPIGSYQKDGKPVPVSRVRAQRSRRRSTTVCGGSRIGPQGLLSGLKFVEPVNDGNQAQAAAGSAVQTAARPSPSFHNIFGCCHT